MAYAASLSQNPITAAAVQAVCEEISVGLKGGAPNLAFLFVGSHHVDRLAPILNKVTETLRPDTLLACTTEAVACVGTEVESGVSLAMWAATLPGADIVPFHVVFENTPDGVVCDGLPDPPPEISDVRAILLLGDPFSCPIHELIERLANDFPGVPLLGGMSSFWRRQSDPKLGLNNGVKPRGAVGAIIRGGPRIRTVVSQGCRPIGNSFVVTKSEKNVILDLGGLAALTRLEQTYAELSERDRLLIRDGLHVGIAIDEYKDHFSRGDFLISNVISADKETGAITIGNLVRAGQTVQFHIRDAEAAAEDLRVLLSRQNSERSAGGGALLFSCNGRGTRLFPTPNHDAALVQELCGPLPLAGFFARGELGPIGRRNFIHGFTASIALFDDDS
ncbi:MAG: FIST C-terminal domain-containing protein, partial [Planctomycetota bacterium]|nr:FIST C-terminal domain-containing protein [Planctomycetota bacterium]